MTQLTTPDHHYELADGPQTREPGIQKQIAHDATDFFNLIPVSERQALARNPNTSYFRLQATINDPDVSVRQALATNQALDHKLLEQLLNDPNPEVQAIARRHPLHRFLLNRSPQNPQTPDTTFSEKD